MYLSTNSNLTSFWTTKQNMRIIIRKTNTIKQILFYFNLTKILCPRKAPRLLSLYHGTHFKNL